MAFAVFDFAYTLGIAFQIQDDYFDTFGQSSIFGKNIGGDIMNNKKTWLLVETFRRTNGAQRERLNRLMAMTQEQAAQKIEGMQQLYIEAGIKQAAEDAIAEYHKKALAIVGQLELNAAQKEQLVNYANYLINRNK